MPDKQTTQTSLTRALVAIFVIYLAWLVLPGVSYGQAQPPGPVMAKLTTSKDVSQTATELLRELPAESMDQQLPAAVRDRLKEYRAILKQTTQADKLNKAQFDRFVNESEKNLTALRTATQNKDVMEAPTARTLSDCYERCEFERSRCRERQDPHDRVGWFICQLAATGCTFKCTVEAFTGTVNAR